MIRKHLPSIALFMAFTVLFSTVGLAVNIHTCKTTGETISSVTEQSLSCHMDSMDDSRDLKQNQKKTEPDSTNVSKANGKKDCCENDKDHAKVEVQSDKVGADNESKAPSVISFNFIFEILYRLNFSDLFKLNPTKKSSNFQDGASSPYGKQLLKLIEVYIQ